MNNLQTIYYDIQCLQQIIEAQLKTIYGTTEDNEPVTEPFASPVLNQSLYDDFLIEKQPDDNERIVLLLAIIPHIQPDFFDNLIQKYFPQGSDFPSFGGIRGSNHRGLLPTGETAQFIIAGTDLGKRIEVYKLFLEGVLIKENILWLEPVKEGEPIMSGRIILSAEWLNKLFTGLEMAPKFSTDFPAKKITTQMVWADLVLNNYTHNQLNDIIIWMQYNSTIMKDELLSRKLKPGFRVLFAGPSGTGKTLTATLLGKQFDKDVYRIDLSQVVSKYIGETEKNLEKVFTKAEHKDWILFFDEADALFGKRTSVQSAHDRYANQEVSYLLQRIEDYPGLLILASNFKNNLDDAFLRRFHSVVNFSMPNAQERLKLWQTTFPATYKPHTSINLMELAEKHELTGAAILNIIHYASLKTAARNEQHIIYPDLMEGIRKELRKEERTMN